MWNKPFEKLRRRMTCLYAVIFGALILVIVAAAYTFIWWGRYWRMKRKTL